MRHYRLVAAFVVGLGLAVPSLAQDVSTVARSLNPAHILADIKALASDEFEGRGPGTPGEEKTVAYLVDQFKSIGLKPGNPDGTYLQEVPLVGFQVTKSSGTLKVGDKVISLSKGDDWVAVSRKFQPKVEVKDSEIVFVGYGVVAPEYGWDDYKGLDVRGKTVVMLVNDPPVPLPGHPEQLDPGVFKGKAMTYYGRWTYKYEMASRKGAAAAILVHETGPAGYPYSVVAGSWGRENFDIAVGADAPERVSVEAWISLEKAQELFSAAGKKLEDLRALAIQRDFKPIPLGGQASFSIESDIRKVASKNVVGRLEGSDPALKDEFVVYTAHWDHLGRDPKLSGDQIYNGAADNASGVAAVLEIARGFAKVQPVPKRSILFLFVTAEEKGLLGAKYYGTHPLYPLSKTVANLNLDVINLWGRTSDVTNVGQGMNSLDEVLVAVAKGSGRSVKPDAEPEKGFYYRSDHFEFARQGVPALDPKGGSDFIGKPADFAQKTREDYTKNHYHKVSDQVREAWDLTGAAEDAGLMLEVGYRVAQAATLPAWNDGTEFKAIREASLRSGSK